MARAAGLLLYARSTQSYLFGLRSKACDQAGTWGLFGGGTEGDEHPRECLIREFFEETGKEIHPMLAWNAQPLHKFIRGDFQYLTFRAEVEHPFPLRLNWEHTKYVWTPTSKLPKPLHPNLVITMKRLIQEGLV